MGNDHPGMIMNAAKGGILLLHLAAVAAAAKKGANGGRPVHIYFNNDGGGGGGGGNPSHNQNQRSSQIFRSGSRAASSLFSFASKNSLFDSRWFPHFAPLQSVCAYN
ncbi:unnamed protein product [Linum trigynum]|uniref:Uncharacterized protein n=1 Tax=Linum trigynum TaxID=586398 RepID=A0AAV2FD72_9ROSI